MDLWIRSQDKTNLIKVDRLDVSENKIEANLKFHYNGCNYVVLGEYATKERALEVLDEIQSILQPQIRKTPHITEELQPEYVLYKHFVNEGSDIEVVQLNTFVYQMPKE